MKIADLQKLSAEELQKKLAEQRAELVEKARALHAGELQNPHSIKEVRRTIAQTLTLLNQKQQPAAKEEE